MTEHKAPKGKYRVVIFDSFDHSQAPAGDFKTLEDAQAKAKSIGGTMTIAYVHDDKGTIIDRFGSY